MRKIRDILAVLVFVAGCEGQPAASGPKQASMAELGRETEHLVFFNYVGSDTDFHYFTTAEGKRYKVPQTEYQIPRQFPLHGGMELFVSVKDGKLTTPDPKELRALSKEELLHRPYKRKRR